MNRMVFILETIHSLRNDERTTQSVTLIMIGGFFMPKNKFQEVIFTIMMVFVMVFVWFGFIGVKVL